VSDFSDYPDDMFINRTLDERTIEALLAGRAPYGREDLKALASLMAELRTVGDGIAPEPNAALASVLAHGLPTDVITDDVALPVPTGGAVEGPARQASGLPMWKRVRAMISAVISAVAMKVAALGVAAKAALVLTATAAVAAGAAAADLPQAVNNALDRGGQHAPAGSEGEGEEFGAGVSEDAGNSEDPGVDGPAVAEEAIDQADPAWGKGEGNPANDAASDGLDRARENTAGTPAKIPTEVGPAAAEGWRPEDVPQGQPSDVPQGQPSDVPQGQSEGNPQGQPSDVPEGRPETVPGREAEG
jgi:hypothetical protein